MAAACAAKKRNYLAKDNRRLALLETAVVVVEKHGSPALSMISVAEQARVSRQLMYQHFESLDQLMTETMTHIFREGYERVRGATASSATRATSPTSRKPRRASSSGCCT